MVKFTRGWVRGHFMAFIQTGMHVIQCNPWHNSFCLRIAQFPDENVLCGTSNSDTVIAQSYNSVKRCQSISVSFIWNGIATVTPLFFLVPKVARGSSENFRVFLTNSRACKLLITRDLFLKSPKIFRAFFLLPKVARGSSENFRVFLTNSRACKLLITRDLFLKSPKIFRAYFGCHNSLYFFATPRF